MAEDAERYTQENSPFRVWTPLGDDVLLLSSFRGVEELSRPFLFHVTLLTQEHDLDLSKLLRQEIRLSLQLPDEEERLIHGRIARVSHLGTRDTMTALEAEVVPWLWFLSLSRESRIYQEMTAPEILEDLFKRAGFSDFVFRLSNPCPKRTFCVQYRETHLDFVSRLLEDEGLFYFFEHEAGKHTLVISDYNGVSTLAPGLEGVRMARGGAVDSEGGIFQLDEQHGVHPGKVVLADYDYLQPSVKLTANLGDEMEEVYDFPGGYAKMDEGDRRARMALEREEVRRQVVVGWSNEPGLTPGFDFTVTDHSRRDVNRKYLIVRVEHFAHAADFVSGGGGGLDYRNSFESIPHQTPFRPARATPRPLIHGSQTALVVGPAGEEVYTDGHGRIKLHFYWDRVGTRDENSSCWIRVATPWAGKGYGSISVPRIGNEVVVAFEEGDPDRPLVIGSVYNAEQTPPFALPGAGIQMGMKSRSSKGGGGANEITMTDTKGREKVNIHAQYDMSTTVLHDQTNAIRNNRSTAVSVNDTESVGGDQAVSVDGNRTLKVGVDQEVEVGSNQKVTIGTALDTSIGTDEKLTVGASREVAVGTNEEISVGANQKVSVGANGELSVGVNYKVASGVSIELDGGVKVSVKAALMITLEAGGSKIEIGPAGVTIQSPAMVTVMGTIVKLN
jgi:type VI secretion system secreted protein VgrG